MDGIMDCCGELKPAEIIKIGAATHLSEVGSESTLTMLFLGPLAIRPLRHEGSPALSLRPSFNTPSAGLSRSQSATSGSILDVRFLPFNLSANSSSSAASRTGRTQFGRRTRSAYIGTSSVIVIPTTRAPVVPLRAVRTGQRLEPEHEVAPLEPVVLQRRPSCLAKFVPAALQRRNPSLQSIKEHAGPEDDTAPLLPGHSSPVLLPVFGIASAKYGATVASMEIANRPSTGRRRPRPVSGYFYRVEADEEDVDENMPEVREAMRVNAAISAMGYRYEPLSKV
ncbi:hypothetical protein C8R47DRAFT_1064181 [Mycena vitilis]|nr:hypothetical protein C8R47DRAFT_1064181 [Mycena vitilis]